MKALTTLPGPFAATISITLAITIYLVAGPAAWLRELMQLTAVAWDFKFCIFGLGLAFLAIAWIGENYVFQRLARAIGSARQTLTRQTKKRKEYKVILDRMRI